MEIPDLSSVEGAQFLDNHLKDRSYITGFNPTQADTQVWGKMQGPPSDKFENLSRWYTNISSYEQDKKSFPPSDIELKFAQVEKTEVNLA